MYRTPYNIRTAVLTLLSFIGIIVHIVVVMQRPAYAKGAKYPVSSLSPSRPVTIIIPFTPGGIVDIQANVLAQIMQRNTGISFEVVYRSGGAGSVGMREAKEALPDGHTMVITSMGPCCLTPHRANVGYVTPRDFRSVARISTVSMAVAVRENSKLQTFSDLIEYTKEQHGSTYGTNGPGLLQHVLFSSLLHSIPEASMQHVPFEGGAAAVIGLLLEETDISVQIVPEYLPYYRAGQIRLLATTRKEDSKYFLETPTFQEMGFKPIKDSNWFGIMVPHKTPDAIVLKFQNMIKEALNDEDLKRTFDLAGISIDFLEGDKFDEEIISEYTFFGNYLHELN